MKLEYIVMIIAGLVILGVIIKGIRDAWKLIVEKNKREIWK